MLPLLWTERAIAHLGGIVEYISLTSPVYAEGVVLRIDQQLQLTRTHPQIGKQVPEVEDPAIRELVISPYRVFYRLHGEAI